MTTLTPMLTVKQVAEILQVSKRTVWRLVERGELTPLRLDGAGSSVRFTEDNVRSLIERHTQEGPQ